MKPGKNIDNVIANIVTRIALAFPVAYIQSISFFSGTTKIGFCTWENLHHKGLFQFYDLETADACNSSESLLRKTVVVDAIDMNGCSIKLSSPFTI